MSVLDTTKKLYKDHIRKSLLLNLRNKTPKLIFKKHTKKTDKTMSVWVPDTRRELRIEFKLFLIIGLLIALFLPTALYLWPLF